FVATRVVRGPRAKLPSAEVLPDVLASQYPKLVGVPAPAYDLARRPGASANRSVRPRKPRYQRQGLPGLLSVREWRLAEPRQDPRRLSDLRRFRSAVRSEPGSSAQRPR